MNETITCADCGKDIPVMRDSSGKVIAEDCRECGKTPQARLEYLRTELRAERISYGELAELQSLAKYIQPGDVELLEAAGVPEA